MTISASELSRVVSHALRHEPWIYELELDAEGWVSIESLIAALHELGPSWAAVDQAAVEQMIEQSSKRRHELSDGRIRALYGHSVPGRLKRLRSEPPDQLFHGTSPSAWKAIKFAGLQPMHRQFVHLSVDLATAEQVGRRKSPAPVILAIGTAAAQAAGVEFFEGNDFVWLTDYVPAEFIRSSS